MIKEKKGAILIISGPSGCGKSTLLKEVYKDIDDYYFSISTTTRAPRVGEVNGVDYFFVTKKEFEKDINNGDFLEYAKVHDNYYGTSLNIGGILDHSELSKINNILREDVIQNEINLEKTDWKDIAAIIDDALEEVKEYEFDLTQTPIKHYNLVLSNFHINELRPLLEKFDQTVIDRLSSGESVDIRLSLKG